jgi:hypothetical protein
MLGSHGVSNSFLFIKFYHFEPPISKTYLPVNILSANYLYAIFQHQVCVYCTKEQYDRSHELLSKMLDLDMCTKIFSPECINAIQQFQINIKERECYLAFYVHSKISMSFDAITTSPDESMNSSLKRGMGINKNSNTRYVNV